MGETGEVWDGPSKKGRPGSREANSLEVCGKPCGAEEAANAKAQRQEGAVMSGNRRKGLDNAGSRSL